MSEIVSVIAVGLFFISFSMFSFSGQAEKKHEALTHIFSKKESTHSLSLDDVIPSSQSIFISPTAANEEDSREPVLIRVTGYSAFESEKDAKSEAKRLLALRASKLDAYRALAERVYGISISGKSLVKDFVLKEDRFAVALDSHIRGARVVSVNEKKDLGFETVLELILPGNFDDCLNKVNNFKNGLNCLRPLPNTSLFLEGGTEPDSLSKKSWQTKEQRNGSGYFLN